MREALEAEVRSFHVESPGEMEALAQVASLVGRPANVAVRINPDVEAGTHPHITTGTRANKFGVAPDQAAAMVRRAAQDPWLRPVGLHVHIGSQLLRVQPIVEATARVLEILDLLASDGIHLGEIDIGGGLGIAYRPEDRPEGAETLAAGLRPLLAERDLDLLVEPGRFLVGPAGALLTTVLYTKQVEDEQTGAARTFAVVDAGMNDLLRPALYGAWHPVWPARQPESSEEAEAYDVVGPVCESADVLARGRELGPSRAGDVLAIGQAGAYGYSMASQYNGRPRPAEVLVTGTEARLIRPRETYDDLWPVADDSK
jgi:diaminopimelate decarboxylase